MTNLILIAQEFSKLNISLYYVGGCVRDEFLGIESEDIDICLVGATKEQVMEVLSSFPCVLSVAQEVGSSFPVWIADIEGFGKVDFALARGEKKTGITRQDFECTTDAITIEQDLLRRDLTINSIAKNVLTGQIVDPFGGVQHLLDRIAHPTSEAFAEDMLRVLRAARFCSRYDLRPSQSLIDMCKSLDPTIPLLQITETEDGLEEKWTLPISNERVGMELYKTMKQAVTPSIFFDFLREVNWLGYFFKELEDLIGVRQSAIHHPEGDAYTHTLLCVDQANDYFTRIVMLCHDLGKAVTTTISDSGKIQAIGHEAVGVPLALAMMQRIKLLDYKFQEQVCLLVELHMIHTQTISEKIVRRTLRRLIDQGLTYSHLVEVCRCDVSGRTLPPFTPNIGQERAQELLDQDLMSPVVTGKILLSLGLKPGKELGDFVRKALELQDRGTLNSSNWLQTLKGCGLRLPVQD